MNYSSPSSELPQISKVCYWLLYSYELRWLDLRIPITSSFAPEVQVYTGSRHLWAPEVDLSCTQKFEAFHTVLELSNNLWGLRTE